MAALLFGPKCFDADLVIFDKDGTLIDFAGVWGKRVHAGVEALCAAIDADIILRGRLYVTLGYDPYSETFVEQSPTITAPMHDMFTIPAVVLYQHGYGWLEAVLLVQEHYKPVMDAPLREDEIQPLADLSALFATLKAAKVSIAVVTSDNRAPTLQALHQLGLTGLVEFMVGADDGYAYKPAPDALLATCAHFGVDPARVAMVGDSTTDLVMARHAGIGLRVGVLTGVMQAETLAPLADVVLPHVGMIQVESTG